MPLYTVKFRKTRIYSILLVPASSAEDAAERCLAAQIRNQDAEDLENGLVKVELLGVAKDGRPMPEPPEDPEKAALRARIVDLEARVADLETPDMLWDEPECGASLDASSLLIEAWRSAAEHAGEVESGPVLVEMECARSLPIRWGVAWSEGGLIEHETFLSQAAAMGKLKALEAGGAHGTAS
ncbi:hypothetical protein [Neomegalonema sp.]|uniref:hypothetical protein n=1 Tax=Neomegalonema sp. TaxID=2039713 RepID=UPI00260E06E1|nr:hypothetical protein [Neomegalonema sp.]MDD2867712.1 hypothetical protein [Neomegalonema sp.]